MEAACSADAGRTRRRTLALAVLLALIVLPSRLSGLRHDAPYVFDGDGQRFVDAGLKAAASGDPGWYGFPASTYIYPLALAYRIAAHGGDFAEFARQAGEAPQTGFVPARVVSGIASVLAIPATAALALALELPPAAALGAAALVGVSSGHWVLAHLVRSDMLLVLFATLACGCAVRAARGSARAATLGGAAAGLAMASKWPGLLAWAPVLLAIALAGPEAEVAVTPRRRAFAGLALLLAGAGLGAWAYGWHYEWKALPGFEHVPPYFRDGGVFLRRNLLALAALAMVAGGAVLAVPRVAWWAVRMGADRRVWASALALALAFALSGPFVLLGGDRVVQSLVYEARSQSLTERGQPGLRNLFAYVAGPLADDLGPIALLAGVAGLAWLVRERGRSALPAVAWPCLWLAYYSLTNIRSTRYVAVLIPPLAIGASALAFRLLALPGRARVLAPLLLAALLVPPALEIARLQREVELPDTRALASDWFAANVPKGHTVAAEEHSVQLCEHCYRVTWPGGLYKLERQPDLVVTSSAVHDYFLADPQRFAAEVQRYAEVLSGYRPLARFHPAADVAQGPEIVVYVRR